MVEGIRKGYLYCELYAHWQKLQVQGAINVWGANAPKMVSAQYDWVYPVHGFSYLFFIESSCTYNLNS